MIRDRQSNRGGFTLIEMMFAMGALAVVTASAAKMLQVRARLDTQAMQRLRAELGVENAAQVLSATATEDLDQRSTELQNNDPASLFIEVHTFEIDGRTGKHFSVIDQSTGVRIVQHLWRVEPDVNPRGGPAKQ